MAKIKIVSSKSAYGLIFPHLRKYIGVGKFLSNPIRKTRLDWVEYCEWLYVEFCQSGYSDIGKFVLSRHKL